MPGWEQMASADPSGWRRRWFRAAFYCVVTTLACSPGAARAIDILIDYRYDTNNFFNTDEKKDALKAAADRYSRVITTNTLIGVAMANDSVDPRIGFTHPGNGQSWQVSAADSQSTDSIVAAGGVAANHYRGPWSIGANQWILYAGGRDLVDSLGVGGTGSGTNFIEAVFENETSHINRGFRATSVSGNLPVWGGAISFDSVLSPGNSWHFDVNTPAPNNTFDFYSIALHEIGHALGLSASNWIDWNQFTPGTQFTGPLARAAYASDNGTSVPPGLALESASDEHWNDAMYDSRIFANGIPNYAGTAGAGNLQDLLMEPVANTTASIKRFELTNVDVAALDDIGWSVLPTVNAVQGDYNGDGKVDGADYVMWKKGSTSGTYAIWRRNFGNSASGAGGGGEASFGVPEPGGIAAMLVGFVTVLLYWADARNRQLRPL
jgi:hypothetical protein